MLWKQEHRWSSSVLSGLHAKPFLFFYFPTTEVATCSPRLPIFKVSYWVRPFGVLTSDARILIKTYQHITLLTWVIVPDSKSNSSPPFGLFSWVTIAWHWVRDIVSVLYYTASLNRSFSSDRMKSIVYTIYGRFHPTEHGFRTKKNGHYFIMSLHHHFYPR